MKTILDQQHQTKPKPRPEEVSMHQNRTIGPRPNYTHIRSVPLSSGPATTAPHHQHHVAVTRSKSYTLHYSLYSFFLFLLLIFIMFNHLSYLKIIQIYNIISYV
jgi:hypothetical protein